MPDVVFLQEVVEMTENILRQSLEQFYEFASSNLNLVNYYVMILNRRKTCSKLTTEVVSFANTQMGRSLLLVEMKYKNEVNFSAMTAHLESTAEFSKQRVEQLCQCFKKMQSMSTNMALFGGDLNIRDSELTSMGGIPNGIYDMWECTGKRKECLYTWDCTRNNNLSMNGKFKPRLRFDRLFYKPLSNGNSIGKGKEYTLMPVYFELEGLERAKGCMQFCSDHWAIQAYCKLKMIK